MRIEIFSDVVCPWCYIGKRRLDLALAGEAGKDVEVTWRPFQLYPQLPAQGVDRDRFFRARFGESADASQVYKRIVAEAESVGLELNFRAVEKMPNTLLAHRLLAWAEGSGLQHELADALFRSYFQLGLDVGDLTVLAAAAAAVGLDGEAAARYLGSDEGLAEVTAQLDRGHELGVTGVPFFVLAGKFAIPGAQTPQVMAQLIARAKERFTPAA